MVQLSAHNTPQFDWIRSRLPNRAEPVPPIYQPEVAAKAVLWAAQHYRREHIIGFPAWKGIYGNMLFPGYGDRYLAKNGYKSQQTAEKRPADQPDNLYRSIDGDFRAHGRFDRMAIEKDHFFEITRYVPFHVIILVCLVIILVSILIIAG
jgi:hypothetical protein